MRLLFTPSTARLFTLTGLPSPAFLQTSKPFVFLITIVILDLPASPAHPIFFLVMLTHLIPTRSSMALTLHKLSLLKAPLRYKEL